MSSTKSSDVSSLLFSDLFIVSLDSSSVVLETSCRSEDLLSVFSVCAFPVVGCIVCMFSKPIVSDSSLIS